MNSVKIFSIVGMILCLIGCTSIHRLMINSNGQMIDCNAAGHGLLGVSLAEKYAEDCVDSWEKAGYLELDFAGFVGMVFRADSTMRILQVIKDAPADKAGILVDDKLISVNGVKVTSLIDAKRLLFGRSGEFVTVIIERNGKNSEYVLKRASYTSIFGKSRYK